MYHYFAYNLHIQSDIVFPELVPFKLSEDVGVVPDIAIYIRPISLSEVEFSNSYQKFQGQIPFCNIERFMVLDGREITIDPPVGLTESLLRSIILGPVLTLLLRQRGLLVLHASGISTPEGAVAFIGNSGWGKSTLANAFYNRGYSLITDDVIAVRMKDGLPITFPAYPHVKLMSDAADALGYDYDALVPLSSKAFKRHNCIDRAFSQAPVPLRKIYALENVPRDRNEIESISPQTAVIELIRHTRGTNVLTSSDYMSTHLRQCSELVKSIPISRLKRRKSLDGLPEIIQIVESDIEQLSKRQLLPSLC